MVYSARIALLVSLALLAPGCSAETSPLDSIAVQMSGAANRCVADVRDRKVKYESSENCRSLGRLAQQYIAAGGLNDSALSALTVSPRAQGPERGWRLPFRKPAIRT